MGKEGQKIVNMDVKTLIDLLNRAYADEWLAYYQYWIGAKLAQGLMRNLLAAEFEEHAKEELDHAGKLAARIISLGGSPLLHPRDWFEKTKCGYEEPKDSHTRKLLAQNLKGERCAIIHYREILEKIKDKDPITFNLVLGILEDEVKHEEDLEAIERDMEDVPKK